MQKSNQALLKLLSDFIATESASGIVMLMAAAIALGLANSNGAAWYHAVVGMPVTLGFGNHAATESFGGWVNDGLMVLFFFVIGMELKREMCEGFLARRDQILLPLAAALGGMLVPAAIFLGFNHADPIARMGWAIPCATDIAFALCVLTLAGRSIPRSAKIFLLAIAIFDDLGAILIIAAFYSTSLAVVPLLLALLGFGALALLNRRQVSALLPYVILGIYLWFCLHAGGIHTTIAGVAVGLAIPMRIKQQERSPLDACLHALHPWVSFLILPIFAFAGAGVTMLDMEPGHVLQPLPVGIISGLFIGKQVGIFGITWICVRMGMADKPEGVSWAQIYGISVIAGIGFTMSLFINLLAFTSPELQEMAKIGIIAGSLLSATWGFILLRYIAKPARTA